MKKRVVSALLCAVMMLTLLPTAWAATAPTEDEAAQVLAALDIMTGNEDGDLMLDRAVTRAEFTKLVIAASPLRDNVGPEIVEQRRGQPPPIPMCPAPIGRRAISPPPSARALSGATCRATLSPTGTLPWQKASP